MQHAPEKPFDWKRSGVYSWKAAFPLSPPERVLRAPEPPAAAKTEAPKQKLA